MQFSNWREKPEAAYTHCMAKRHVLSHLGTVGLKLRWRQQCLSSPGIEAGCHDAADRVGSHGWGTPCWTLSERVLRASATSLSATLVSTTYFRGLGFECYLRLSVKDVPLTTDRAVYVGRKACRVSKQNCSSSHTGSRTNNCLLTDRPGHVTSLLYAAKALWQYGKLIYGAHGRKQPASDVLRSAGDIYS
jgi:hypothetical protein